MFLPMSKLGVATRPRGVEWQEAKIFAEKGAPDMASVKPSPQDIWVWFKSVSIYHQGEVNQAERGDPTEEERDAQRRTLSVLINVGEWLVMQLRQNGKLGEKAGITTQDVEATLEELYDSLRVWFGGMTAERRAQVLDEVFGAS